MANVLSRTPPYQYRRSVNDPDYDIADWIFNPDLSAVTGFGPQYWIVTGDVVTLMNQAARDAVDAQAIADSIAAQTADLKTQVDGASPLGIDIRALIQNSNRRINYLTNRVEEIQTILSDVRDQTSGTQARQNIPGTFPLATNTRTLPAAIADYKADVDDSGVSG